MLYIFSIYIACGSNESYNKIRKELHTALMAFTGGICNFFIYFNNFHTITN